jgi:hypothetical protein
MTPAVEQRAAASTVPRPTANPELRTVQENEEYGIMWKTLDGVLLGLTELARPQKSLFAGYEAWQNGATLAQAWDVTKDEFTWGIGTGNFKRDVSGANLLVEGPTPSPFFSAAGLGGLALDFIADPINAVPVGKVARGLGWLGSGAARGGAIAIDAVGGRRAREAFIDGFTKTFFRPKAGSDAGRAAEEAATSINSFIAEHQEVLLHNHALDNRAWRKLSDETGMSTQEFNEFIVEQMRTVKAADPGLLPEALNDTFARIYRDYGIDGFDDYLQRSGYRALSDERELRRGIINSNFERANAAMVRDLPGRVTDDISNVLFELKERDLERFVFEKSQRVKSSGIQDLVVESMERDYVMIAATPEFRQVVENLALGGRTTSGFAYSPFHTSQIHSQLQEIGINEANRLLRESSKEFPGLSQFVLRHPETNQAIHLPKMGQGFHTDPRLIDTVREYYARRAVETSKVLDDLVDGYGARLDDFIEADITLPDGSTGRGMVQTFQEAAEVVRPGAVAERGLGFQPGGAGEVIRGRANVPLTEQAPRFTLTREAGIELEKRGMTLLHGVEGFENVALPDEAAQIVMKVGRWSEDVGGDLGQIGELIDTIQNKVWKPFTLFPFPGYQTRNVVTNTYLQHLMGMNGADIVQYNAKAVQILSSGAHGNAHRRAWQSVKDFAGKSDNRKVFENISRRPELTQGAESLADQSIAVQKLVDGIKYEDLPGKDQIGLLHLATQLGIVRSGQYGVGEIQRTLEVAAETFSRHPLRRLTGLTVNTNRILATGAEAAGFAEDSQRLAAFLYNIEKKGMDVLEARDLALKSMVNFNNLSATERQVIRKYAVPFYAWARNATPLMAESLIFDNAKWRNLNKVMMAQEQHIIDDPEQGVLPDRMVPEYVARGMNVPVARGQDGDYRYFLLDGWIPQSQLTEIDTPEEIMEFIPQQLGPVVKTAIELLIEESMFLDKDFAIGNRSYLGARLPEWTITILRNVRLLNTADNMIKATQEGSGRPMEEVRRFFTGLNTVRKSQAEAAASYSSRVADMRRRITADIREAARTGNHDEIPDLVQKLQAFIREGR